ncbi:EAP30/Vps36 family-domain-containing protein [Umbelopsis sp. PMI_123]|nr:EAP30/Vps36 family-domain-containing protein [Umbelopsis sp. PMI_123]
MDRCKPVDLSSSHRPVFLPNERLLASQGPVGLYNGKEKSIEHQEGVGYLTSHRLIYVDSKDPRKNSVQLELALIKSIDTYAGFLSRSPKITIYLDSTRYPPSSLPMHSDSSSTLPTKVLGMWTCPICSYQNTEDIEKCQLCGVIKPANIQVTTSSPTSSTPQVVETDVNACPVCTFINHPSMVRCEMCDSEIGKASSTPVLYESGNASPVSITPPPEEAETDDPYIKIAFRVGGYTTWLSNLKSAIAAKAWEQKVEPELERPVVASSRGVGISAIQERIEKTRLDAAETLTDAFKDLDGLMAKAAEMVKLAESITTKINKEPQGSGTSENDTLALNTYLMELGISNPVTRDSTGSSYHQELARELAEFLVPILDRQGGMKSLADVYCLFNRARGVALISPEDLYKSSCQFDTLQLPVRLKRYESGLLVIQSLNLSDDRVVQRIVSHVRKYGPLTAMKVAELENLALPVAVEQLYMTEAKGLLCRDTSSAGITFYENLFLQNQQITSH